MHTYKKTFGLLAVVLAAAMVQAAAPTISCKTDGNDLIVTYTGTLYQSSDAVKWTEVASASSPYQVKMGNKKLFFCAKGESKNFTISLSDTVDLNMIWIEPGTFIMGSPEDELGRWDDEVQHEVTLTKEYWLGKYEVTQAQYKAVMGKNPSYFWLGNDWPVEQVSWDDAMDFCAKLTAIEKEAGRVPEGYGYTLPTEAQWEYACRAGTTTALNSGKDLSSVNKCSEMDEVGWYGYNSDDMSQRVGQKQPNAWGLYDMHGNVWEWCSDWRGDYPTSAVVDPKGPDTGWNHIMRGGSWANPAVTCRSARRGNPLGGSSGGNLIGFRVALAPVPPTGDMTIPLSETVNLDMIWIKPGTFMMGSPEDELGRNAEKEIQHQVTLTKAYWLGKYEVTQAQYETIMETNPAKFKGADLPVEMVSWSDAKEFCKKLTEIEKEAGRLPDGYEYTLPTEAQWEYACRAGTTTALNSGKNLSDMYVCPEMDEVGWYVGNSDETTHPAGQKQPNAWGLYDMHGNVMEWCLDIYWSTYPSTPVTDPTGADSGSYMVVRGGLWVSSASGCRSASRSSCMFSGRLNSVGFRVALAPVK
ncbi:MAG: formylglycine-generating enzyme family protein [Verrucomicrobia bacterium]|nr:formylglycine-generating enzyme family protein [Verrucomicrobiota bacterium]